MKIEELFEKVDNDDNLEGVGIDNTNKDSGLVIKYKPKNISIRLPVESIIKTDWDNIKSVLYCEREPIVLQHMTRVVGYYSKIENWNKSKIGELKDRHTGNYEV